MIRFLLLAAAGLCLIAQPNISTFAGARPLEGQGLEIALPVLSGLAAGPGGEIYTASPSDHVIYRRTPDGTLSIFAGTGWAVGNSEDGAPATESRLLAPSHVKTGPDGSVYFFDTGRIRRVSASSGQIETVFSQSALAANESLWRTYAIHANGDLLMTVDRTRMLRLSDGQSSPAGRWPDGATTLDVTIDKNGAVVGLLEINGSPSIWRVDAAGETPVRIAGGDNLEMIEGAPLAAGFPSAAHLAAASDGSIWVAGRLVQRIDPEMQQVRRIAGSLDDSVQPNPLEPASLLLGVSGISVVEGTAFVTSYQQIFRIDSPERSELLAGTGSGYLDSPGKDRTGTRLTGPTLLMRNAGGSGLLARDGETRALVLSESAATGLHYDTWPNVATFQTWTAGPDGKIYLAGQSNAGFHVIDPSTNQIQYNYASTASLLRTLGAATSGNRSGVFFEGELLWAHQNVRNIYKVVNGTYETYLAPDEAFRYFSGPLRTDGRGNLYWIRRGGGFARYNLASKEFTAIESPTRPAAFDVDDDGNLYVASFVGTPPEIWKVTPEGKATKLAGGQDALDVEDGPAESARVYDVRDLVYLDGSVYFTEGEFSRIRRIDGVK